MKLRRTAFERPISFVFALVFTSIIGWIALRIIVASLDENSPAHRYLTNNVITNLVCPALVSLIAAGVSLRHGIWLPRVVFGDERRTLSASDLSRHFDTDATISPTKDHGWRMEGNGAHQESVAKYNSNVDQLFSVAAQFKPRRKTAAANYWRCGFKLRRPDGSEAVVVHLDSHNLLVGYLNGAMCLRLPLSYSLEDNWSLLELQLSVGEPPEMLRIFCHVNKASWCLGTIPAQAFPWSLAITAWSNQHKRHVVMVRDISVSHALA